MGPQDRQRGPSSWLRPGGSLFFDDGSEPFDAPRTAAATGTSTVAGEPAAAAASGGEAEEQAWQLAASQRHDSVVIWLHGLGETGLSWAALGRRLRTVLPTTRFLFPTAPIQRVTCHKGRAMHSWFDVNSLQHKKFALDPPGLAESSAKLQQLVERQLAEGIPPERIVLVGFSQGGSVVLDLLCKGLPGITIGAALVLSGFLANTPPEQLPQPCPPVHFFHGDADKLVPRHWARSGCDALRNLGMEAFFHSYVGLGHSTHVQEVQDISDILVEVLGVPLVQHSRL